MTRKRAIKLLMSLPGVDRNLAEELFQHGRHVAPRGDNEDILCITIGTLLEDFPKLRPQAAVILARRMEHYLRAYPWRRWEEWFPSYYI